MCSVKRVRDMRCSPAGYGGRESCAERDRTTKQLHIHLPTALAQSHSECSAREIAKSQLLRLLLRRNGQCFEAPIQPPPGERAHRDLQRIDQPQRVLAASAIQ